MVTGAHIQMISSSPLDYTYKKLHEIIEGNGQNGFLNLDFH